jgi:hypothetical protein
MQAAAQYYPKLLQLLDIFRSQVKLLLFDTLLSYIVQHFNVDSIPNLFLILLIHIPELILCFIYKLPDVLNALANLLFVLLEHRTQTHLG